jgi:hypothetical protein
MLLKDIVKDGRHFQKNAKFMNRRTRTHEQIITVVKEDREEGTVTYHSRKAGQSHLKKDVKTVPMDEFAVFVDKTFGGWKSEYEAKKRAERDQERVAAYQAEVNAAHDEALAFEARMEALTARPLTREEVYSLVVRDVNRAYWQGRIDEEQVGSFNRYLDNAFSSKPRRYWDN